MQKILKFVKTLISLSLICAGFILVLYPTASTTYYNWQTDQYIDNYEKKHKKKKEINKEEDPLYKEIDAYNHEIFLNKQKDFKDAWSYKQTPVSLPIDKKYGYIEIKSIDVKLPLFIGATDENLANGVAILGGTSIPIGTTDSNSAIAGHRGYRGIPYFREIEGIHIGDEVKITNPWEKLIYVVTDIDIIDPSDTDRVKIQEGKDMITLITCHPYRSHGKFRYLVFCERKGTEQLGKDKTKGKDKKQEFLSSKPDIKRENKLRIFALVFVILMTSKMIYEKLFFMNRD